MINLIEINGQEYPFYFGMRAFYNLSASQDKELDELDLKDYGTALKLFCFANKAGHKKDGGELIDEEALEESIDKDPAAFGKLMQSYKSSDFQQAIEKEQEEVKKKSKKKG